MKIFFSLFWGGGVQIRVDKWEWRILLNIWTDIINGLNIIFEIVLLKSSSIGANIWAGRAAAENRKLTRKVWIFFFFFFLIYIYKGQFGIM
jgi:hypothetical protein